MECRTSIPRTLGMAGLGVLMILASYYVARTASGLTQGAGWFGVVFFACGLVVILVQLFRRGPIVVLDESGVFDRRLGVGRIPWQDISSVSVTQIRSQRFISLWLRNEEEYLSRFPGWKSTLGRASEKIGYSPFLLSLAGLTPGLDEAYAYIRAKVPEHAGV
jgi:hypothetical protein